MEVSSDKRRKYRYVVTINDIIVHRGNDATKVLQWAIDYCKDKRFKLNTGVYENVKNLKNPNGKFILGETK